MSSFVLSDAGLVEKLELSVSTGNLVIPDWCSFTFVPPSSWQLSGRCDGSEDADEMGGRLSDSDILAGLRFTAEQITGFRFSEARNINPQGYRAGMQWDSCVVAGFHGAGPRVLLTFSGQAFQRGDFSMPRRIFDFLGNESSSRITRIDLAFDDFDGSHFCPYRVFSDWENGLFDYRSVRPKVKIAGDFYRCDPDQRGVTVYIGSEGKQLCVYEKGKQLGNPDSKHVRAEVRISQNAYSITRDVLLNPTAYFCGAYPYLACRVSNLTGDILLQRFEGVVREGSDSVEKVIQVIKHQFGKHLDWLRKNYFASEDELLNAVCRDDGKLPPVLKKAEMLITRCESMADSIKNETPF